VIDGVPTGMSFCEDGTLHRTGPTVCRLHDLSTDIWCPGANPAPDHRVCNEGCDEGPYAVARRSVFGGAETCVYYCETDADCPSGRACTCDQTGEGQCTVGECASDADCGASATCRQTDQRPIWCYGTDFVATECFGPIDDCFDLRDCPAVDPTGAVVGEDVRISCGRTVDSGTKRVCSYDHAYGCGGGRPIFVEGAQLVAPLLAGVVW
jgi:hypothetical protein